VSLASYPSRSRGVPLEISVSDGLWNGTVHVDPSLNVPDQSNLEASPTRVMRDVLGGVVHLGRWLVGGITHSCAGRWRRRKTTPGQTWRTG
jgi:hypothetical protein